MATFDLDVCLRAIRPPAPVLWQDNAGLIRETVISLCGNHRYMLHRKVYNWREMSGLSASRGIVAFFGVNPSTADGRVDDATIRKMLGFAARWGFSEILVGNVFTYRATDVRELRHVPEGLLNGPEAMHYLKRIVGMADLLVPCWGSTNKLPKSLRSMPWATLDVLQMAEAPAAHLGLTTSGAPNHPLMLGYDTPLQQFT